MNRLNFLIIMFAVLLIAAYSSWLLTTFKPGQLVQKQPERHDPDYFFEGVKTTLLDANGHPSYRLTATRINHYPDDDSVTLQNPHVWIFAQKPAKALPWEIDADRGRIIKRGEQIHLLGNVRAERAASPITAATRLDTQDLTIEPHKSYAVTAAKVRIRHGSHHLRGTGMEVYFDQGRLEILAQGVGTYAAPR